MTNISIARPYAKAAFEFAKSKNDLQNWSLLLHTLSVAIETPLVFSALSDPFVPSEKMVDLLLDIVREAGVANSAASSQGIENFLNLLAEYKRLSILPEIAMLFEEDVAKDQGYLQLSVTSAFPLNADQQAKIEARMKAQLASDVRVSYEDDPAIIGGIIVRSGHWVLDDSVRGRLARMQSALQ